MYRETSSSRLYRNKTNTLMHSPTEMGKEEVFPQGSDWRESAGRDTPCESPREVDGQGLSVGNFKLFLMIILT